jgi:cytochrome c oxidase subunit 4
MSDHAHATAHTDHEHAHPSWKEYKWVALFLTLVTVVEVWVYYTPFKETPYYVPALLIMSAAKFATVVALYMHLKYDHKIFRALFVGPLFIAMSTLLALMFLFSKLKISF